VDKMKQWVVLAVVAALVVVVGGWMFLVSPKRATASDLRTQADQANVHNQQLRSQLQVLQAQQKLMPKYEAQLAQIRTQIPDNPALPALIRALTAAADKADVELVTVAPSAPADYRPTGGATAAAKPVSGAAPGAAATPATAAGAAGALKVINLSLNVVGGYFETENFFNQLESLSRAFKVTTFQMGPGTNPLSGTAATSTALSDGRVLATTMNASVFMAPSTAAAPVAAAPVK
jgi:Tfp pilus assembly protein PilO